MSNPSPYQDLVAEQKSVATLTAIGSLLGWDQETYMPPAGAMGRAEQQELLSAITHERRTSKRIGELIAACERDPSIAQQNGAVAASVREMRRDYELATRLPTELVAELAKTQALAQDAWKHARENDDFPRFAPWLDKMLALTRRKAECYGVPSGGELYDALLEEYEPGATAREIESVFTPLRARVSALVDRLCSSPRKPADALKGIRVPQEKQHAFGLEVLRAIGFDLAAGRLDTTAHPFCSGFGPGDTRLTTRYNTSSCLEPLSSTMHEAGHGIYEQGLPKATQFGTPLADAVSLGIHESQSRMWENLVGRSRAFWTWALPVAQRHFAPALDGVTLDQVYASVNQVERSFIRVEADEVTYNLHVMLRFGLERDMIAGHLPVKDLPGEWNKRFKGLFGIDVPSDRLGCLQDVHWSFGLIGYFPTYTLGNLYAAQFWETISRQSPDLDAQMARGEFGTLKEWLNEHVHRHGRRYRAGELCRLVTGRPLSADPLMSYLERKYAPLYGV
ncbi:MAG: carboxypeptidase M32 [Phycisphaerales bacterium]|nr:carboxypeptidase M32 [Phycisphaerales bacterium]